MAIIMIVSVWVCPLTVYFSFIPDIGSVCRRHEPSKGKELTKLVEIATAPKEPRNDNLCHRLRLQRRRRSLCAVGISGWYALTLLRDSSSPQHAGRVGDPG